jgi:hypothetical protein
LNNLLLSWKSKTILSRQFETTVAEGYFQLNTLFKKKNISEKINIPDQFDNEEFVSQLLTGIMEIAIEQS